MVTDKVLERTEQDSYTIARWISEPGSAPWLWVSHNPHEQYSDIEIARIDALDSSATIAPGFFVVKVEKRQVITRVGESNG